MADVESALHTAFSSARVNPNREFFELDPEQPNAILRLFGSDITPELQADIDDVTPEADREARRSRRRPRLNYAKVGIHPGSVLVYRRDPSISCTVVDDYLDSFQEGRLTRAS